MDAQIREIIANGIANSWKTFSAIKCMNIPPDVIESLGGLSDEQASHYILNMVCRNNGAEQGMVMIYNALYIMPACAIVDKVAQVDPSIKQLCLTTMERNDPASRDKATIMFLRDDMATIKNDLEVMTRNRDNVQTQLDAANNTIEENKKAMGALRTQNFQTHQKMVDATRDSEFYSAMFKARGGDLYRDLSSLIAKNSNELKISTRHFGMSNSNDFGHYVYSLKPKGRTVQSMTSFEWMILYRSLDGNLEKIKKALVSDRYDYEESGYDYYFWTSRRSA